MEEKKVKGIFCGFSRAREDDMISKLPDSLISQILSYLRTKEVVRTSVLSNRWRNLWLLIPGLDLDSHEFSDYNAFASFIDGSLAFSREENSCLHKVKLSIHKDENDNDHFFVTRWIDFVVTARKLKHLDVECFVKRKCLEMMPVSLFISETLVHLRLRQVLFGSLAELPMSLPRLKTMYLELNVYADERSLESLFFSCPILEDLSFVKRFDDNVKVLRVRSQTLTSLTIKYHLNMDDEVDILLVDDLDLGQLGVLIDAPRLEYLNLEDEISYSKTITNPGSLTKVNILGAFNLEDSADQVRKFFTSFSRVNDLKFSSAFFEHIKRMVPLPQFCNLSCLEAEFPFFDLELLPSLLASCPNLRSLILDLVDSFVGKPMRQSSVPLCLLSSLEYVEIKCYFNGYRSMELVWYFAQNSVILKKLVLRLRSSTPEKNSVVLWDIIALPGRSSKCQIIVC